LRDFGQRANAQALQAHMGGQAERGINDDGFGVLPFDHGLGLCNSGGWRGNRRTGGVGHECWRLKNKTNGRAFLF
jgi:hypothetical protein